MSCWKLKWFIKKSFNIAAARNKSVIVWSIYWTFGLVLKLSSLILVSPFTVDKPHLIKEILGDFARNELVALLQNLFYRLCPHELAQPGGGVVEEGGPGGGESLPSHIEDDGTSRLSHLPVFPPAVQPTEVQPQLVLEWLSWRWHSRNPRDVHF